MNKTSIVMRAENRLGLTPGRLDGTTQGAKEFNAKIDLAEKAIERAVKVFDESKDGNADKTYKHAETVFRCQCAALERERRKLMHEVATHNVTLLMDYPKLLTKAPGPEAKKHNAAVMAFGVRVMAVLKRPQDNYLAMARIFFKRMTDLSQINMNIEREKCEIVAGEFMAEYTRLANGAERLDKKSRTKKEERKIRI